MVKADAARNALDKFLDWYSRSNVAQDLAETGMGAAISAGGQLLFTDMTPQEIALSTGLGFGAAMATRPIGGTLGRAVGRMAPAEWDDAFTDFQLNNSFGRSLGIPTQAYMENFDDILVKLKEENPGQAWLLEKARPLLDAKYETEFKGRKPLEGALGFMGRQYIDNASQGLVALTTPLIMGNSDDETLQDATQLA